MKVTSCGITDVGMKRANNEDNYLINPELNLYVVCDGMGGHVGGEYASAIAVNTIEEVLSVIETTPGGEFDVRDGDQVELNREKVRYSMRLAGRRIYEKAVSDPEYKGMGTTGLVLLLDGGNAVFGHVGDSRGYLVRGDQIEQITEDHSLVNEKVRAGLMSREEAKTHRMRNIITRSLGYQEEVEVDTQVQALQGGDRFVLCSDGLSNLISTIEIGEVVRRQSSKGAARELVKMACDRGGDDNITVIVTHVDSV